MILQVVFVIDILRGRWKAAKGQVTSVSVTFSLISLVMVFAMPVELGAVALHLFAADGAILVWPLPSSAG